MEWNKNPGPLTSLIPNCRCCVVMSRHEVKARPENQFHPSLPLSGQYFLFPASSSTLDPFNSVGQLEAASCLIPTRGDACLCRYLTPAGGEVGVAKWLGGRRWGRGYFGDKYNTPIQFNSRSCFSSLALTLPSFLHPSWESRTKHG